MSSFDSTPTGGGMGDMGDTIPRIGQPSAGSSTLTLGTVNVAYFPVIGKCSPVFKDGRMMKTLKSRHNCIVAMREYVNKSQEELRFEDYMCSRKDPALSGLGATPAATGTVLSPFGQNQSSFFAVAPQAMSATSSEQLPEFGQGAAPNFLSRSTAANTTPAFGQPGPGPQIDMKRAAVGLGAGSTSSAQYGAFGHMAGARLFDKKPHISLGGKSGMSISDNHSGLFARNPFDTGFGQPVSTPQQNFASSSNSLLGNTANKGLFQHVLGTQSNSLGGSQELGSAFGSDRLGVRSQQPSVAQLVLLDYTTPYEDNPIFKNIRRSEVREDTHVLSPETQTYSPLEAIANQSLPTRHGKHFRRQLNNKSPFEGIDDLLTSPDNFKVKPSPKRLELIFLKPNEMHRPDGNSVTTAIDKPLDHDKGVLQPSTKDNEVEENPMHISLKRFGYYTIPSIEDLKSFTAEDGSCRVPTFTIGHKDFGNIYFGEEMDVSGLNLDEIVHFDHTGLAIYANGNIPPPGEGLHRAAQVTLDNIWPLDKTYGVHIKDAQRLAAMGWEDKLKRVCAKQGTHFVEYRPETGSWVFGVKPLLSPKCQ